MYFLCVYRSPMLQPACVRRTRRSRVGVVVVVRGMRAGTRVGLQMRCGVGMREHARHESACVADSDTVE